MGGLKFI